MKRQTFNEINITPLTDIFLVLLIIMMVIAPMLDQQGLNLAIPDYVEKTQNTNDENKILTVTVSADNKYYVDGEEIAENDLFNTIKNKSQTLTDGLMIEAEGDSQHGCVVKLMDTARNAGVKSISLTEI
ncbi:TPA: biopolymer transporter ExbD [Candidatus Galligastranaerophilus intestinavium]|uniref:Biopolymer transporter ExbD n=1 Tax=Candidatus Galligastranaerophilus intestinavium TaxID=2840836 RepID=A0A9D1FI34_9BACT|nr:biopolymer transporter ExbD [Candidatus Galligastranaerophilus intestinavium]